MTASPILAHDAGQPAGWSDRLESHLQPLRALVLDAWTSLATMEDFRERLPGVLIQTYHYVRHSVPLMALACAKLDYRHLSVVRYLGRHIAEEAGHEGWLLKDLALLGWPAEAVVHSVPFPEARQMVGLQRQMIEDGEPLGLLGYIYALEAVPWSRAYLESLQSDLALPAGCLSTFLAHADEDIAHSRGIRSLLDDEVTDAKVRRLMAESAQTTLDSVARLYNALEDRKVVERPVSSG